MIPVQVWFAHVHPCTPRVEFSNWTFETAFAHAICREVIVITNNGAKGGAHVGREPFVCMGYTSSSYEFSVWHFVEAFPVISKTI
jgi:hypothetical protein